MAQKLSTCFLVLKTSTAFLSGINQKRKNPLKAWPQTRELQMTQKNKHTMKLNWNDHHASFQILQPDNLHSQTKQSISQRHLRCEWRQPCETTCPQSNHNWMNFSIADGKVSIVWSFNQTTGIHDPSNLSVSAIYAVNSANRVKSLFHDRITIE